VLFCDLVGSTEIAANLDPEEWRELVAGYHRAASEAITRYGGYVAKYLGDGVMAYFGWPEAHENDAERAARAGLAIVESVAKLKEQANRAKLAARIGIDSGSVVVGAGAGKETDVFGEAPNIAARVQAAAAPDTVLLTASTHRLVSGLFVVEERGAQELKGVANPVELYRVIQPSGVSGRLEAAAVRGLTPFIGREDELRLLTTRWERVLEAEGQVVVIVSEAGIGKSRLVQQFRENLRDVSESWIEAAAGPFFQNTPFYPVSALLRHFIWGQSFDPSAGRVPELHPGQRQGSDTRPHEHQRTNNQLEQLRTGLERAGVAAAEAVPLIAPLLNLPTTGNYPPLPLSPEQQRRRLLAILVEWVLGASSLEPVAMVIEDLHWADPSTLELLELLVEQGERSRLLLVLTTRPEFRAPWPLRAHHTQITLNRLSTRNVRKMLEEIPARKVMSEEIVATIIERTGGVPLFIEELTQALLDSGKTQIVGREIPVTLHDSLMARLDRLGPAKEVAQVGAVIGSEFSYQLLHAVYPGPEEGLKHALRSLIDAELLHVRGIEPDATYQFKHALIRDAAYEALLRSRRKELHELVARTIDEKFSAVREAQPETLARHWTEAGELEPAITEWSRAGQVAQARSAFKEAEENYQQALILIKLLTESPKRDLRELELRQAIIRVLSSPEANRTLEASRPPITL
jgi:predicted ATPase/class 3 adenylate cyclase